MVAVETQVWSLLLQLRLRPKTYHARRNRERPCRGKTNSNRTLPCCMSIHSGEVRNCSCPALSRRLYSLCEGDCGDPISFHAVNALLRSESTRQCSSRPRFA